MRRVFLIIYVVAITFCVMADGINDADISATVTPAKEMSVRDGTCGENLKWTLKDGTLTITGTGNMSGYTRDSPAPWGTMYDCSVTNIVIRRGVTSIGSYAFFKCFDLASVSIPDTVFSIGDSAFCQSSLSNVTIPDSVTSIGPDAFHGCRNLKSVIISDNVKSIGEYAFESCTSLNDVNIPDSLTEMGRSVFVNCNQLKYVFYQGTLDFPSADGVFDGCLLNVLCVSPEYYSSTFCGKGVTFDADMCRQYRSSFTPCYKPLYINNSNSFIQQPRRNTTICTIGEEEATCMKCECSDATGDITPTMLNFEEWSSLIAENHQCYDIVCDNGHWILRNKDSAIEWESQTGDCMNYTCDDQTGDNITTKLNIEIWNRMNATDNHCYDIVCENEQWVFQKKDFFSQCDNQVNSCFKCECNNETGEVTTTNLYPDEWKELNDIHNPCNDIVCDNGHWVFKPKNSSESEKPSNECFVYDCSDITGNFTITPICISSGDTRMICINDSICMPEDGLTDTKWAVEIELNVSDWSSVTVERISKELNENGINVEDITIGIEYDEKKQNIRVILYVKEESDATSIEESIKNMKPSDSCVLCERESVHSREITSKLSLAIACDLHDDVLLLIISMLLLCLKYAI